MSRDTLFFSNGQWHYLILLLFWSFVTAQNERFTSIRKRSQIKLIWTKFKQKPLTIGKRCFRFGQLWMARIVFACHRLQYFGASCRLVSVLFLVSFENNQRDSLFPNEIQINPRQKDSEPKTDFIKTIVELFMKLFSIDNL